MSSTWETWFQYPVVVNSTIQCGRAVVVDGTKAYWASIVFREARNFSTVTIFGFDLKSKSWAYKDLNAGAFLGYSESFFWTDPGFLHLSDHKFCLLLHSVRSPDRVFFLYCIVVDLSAFIGHSCFPKKPLLHSVVSVQKYSLDKRIDLLDCMIMQVSGTSLLSHTHLILASYHLLPFNVGIAYHLCVLVKLAAIVELNHQRRRQQRKCNDQRSLKIGVCSEY